MKKLFLLCGCPASGKSTWARNQIIKNGEGIWISRDQIRFDLLKDDEDYFAHEPKVFEIFTESIQKCIDNEIKENNIYVDASHLNQASRNKTLRALRNLENVEVIPVFFNVPIEIALERNKNRTGRALVPDSVIRKMKRISRKPTFNEIYKYNEIWTVDKNSEIRKEMIE